MVVEHERQPRQHAGVGRIVTEDIRGQHPAVSKGTPAVAVKARSAERRGQAAAVEAVDHDDVGAAVELGQPAGGVGMQHAKARVGGWYGKRTAQGDDIGAHLEHGDLGVGKMAVAELGQRAAAQAHHQDMPRARHEQGEAHDGAAIGQHQAGGIGQAHVALDFAGRKFERAVVAFGAHHGRAEAGSKGRGVRNRHGRQTVGLRGSDQAKVMHELLPVSIASGGSGGRARSRLVAQ